MDYDPTALHLFSNGCFFFATGTNKKLNLHTREGTKKLFKVFTNFFIGSDLGAMAQMDAWPWCMAFKQKPLCVVSKLFYF